MKTLIERSICLAVLAIASCAPSAGEPSRPSSQSALTPVRNLRGVTDARLARGREPQQLAEYVGRYSAETGRITFEPLIPQGSGGTPRPGYTQLLSNTVSLRDNGTTVQAGGSFNSGETCGAGQICAVVTVTNDSARMIESLRVEVVNLSAGATLANPDPLGTNYPSSSGNAGGWNYLAIAAGGSTAAPWRFNLGSGDFSFNVRVWGLYTRTSYTALGPNSYTAASNVYSGDAAWSDASPAWRDACTFGATRIASTASFATAYATPPFPFSMYGLSVDSDSTDAFELSTVGTLSLSQVFNGANVPVTHGSASDYTFYPFWDDLSAQAGSVCEGTDPTSAAPNRRWVITWKNMSLASDTNTRLSFSIVLQEQSDNVYFLYNRWSTTASPSNCLSNAATQGSLATFGVRGNGAGESTAVTGTLPSHLRTCPEKGAFIKLTATPANP